MAKKSRYFVLMEGGSDTEHVFSGKQPRQAALKAASRGLTNIRLRERGSKKVHVFRGSVEIVQAPPNKPSWLPDQVKKPNVRKIGIERL
jgi:hypothetical protein